MELLIGATASTQKTFSEADIFAFAEASGDHNPVHLDEDYAATTMFGQRIAHGMLVSGLISAVLGTQLPGPGTIYMGQTLQFKRPVFIGDTITATVTVIDKHERKPIYTISTICTNQKGKTVIEGEAVVLLPE